MVSGTVVAGKLAVRRTVDNPLRIAGPTNDPVYKRVVPVVVLL